MTALAPRLAAWVAALRFEDIPPEVVASAQDRVMDVLGICVAAHDADAGTAARGLRDEWGAGRPEASFVGEPERGAAAVAALVNGTYAHSLDFDDTHLPSVVHPSAPMVAALLAQAEASGAPGRELLVALVASYELNTRLSMAQYDPELGNSVFFERGLHATSMIGAVAAAAGCARLRGLDAEGIASAIAVACSMGAGLVEANRSGGSVKKFHGGWAAHSAVVAAGAVAHGLTGPPTILEGRFGFFQAYCGERWRPEAVTEALGDRWDTPGIFYKPYPCNHFTHALVDAALAFRARGLRAEEVEHVTIGTAAAPWRTIGDPIEEKRHPRTPYHAAFSGPFVLATALVGGSGLGVSSRDFTEATLNDPQRRRLAEATDVVVDEECTRIFPNQFPAVVRVRTRDGRELEERVLENRGGPRRPLTREELTSKLRDNAGALAEGIAAACARLPELPAVSALFEATRA
jgi:2-methylcitrate dehydratase PrpD